MPPLSPPILAVASALLFAFPASEAAANTPTSGGIAGDEPVSTRAPLRSETVWIDPVRDMPPQALGADEPISKIIFVNKCVGGCTLTPGPNDALANTSSIPETTTVISEFMHSQQVFDDAITCIREVYAPYDVEIVTEDPGPVPHHEAILAGLPAEVGYGPLVGGLSPAACRPLNSIISLTFANNFGPSPLDLCWTVAQESAHAFGLPNHVRDCTDPMTYIPGCGQKFFRDAGLPCGDFELEDCRCESDAIREDVQNSHRALLAVFGQGVNPPPPEIFLQRPAELDAVGDNFDVVFTASDKRRVERVFLFLNGTLYLQAPGWGPGQENAPYRFITPTLPDGLIHIDVRARNDLRIESTLSVTVQKGELCSTDDQCFDRQTCEAGACMYPPATGALGDACEESHECLTGLCPEKGGNKACSEFCNPADAFSCPDTFECIAVNDTGVCWPEGLADIGGCCQVDGGDSSPPLGVVFLSVVVLVAIGRRRRRRDPGAGA